MNLIKEAHGNAVERGFYDLCDCDEGFGNNCSLCNNGTGVIQNKNIGELLMLIVSELGEALEAHRCGRFPGYEKYEFSIEEITNDMKSKNILLKNSATAAYKECVKSTFEDEIADAKIRVLDLMGYLELEYYELLTLPIVWKSDNVAQKIRQLCKYFDNLDEDNLTNFDLIRGLIYIDQLAESFDIDLDKHILAKMAYNRTRPHKHGKSY